VIDTIALKHCYLKIPPVDRLLSLGWKPRFNSLNGSIQRFIFSEGRGSKVPRLTLSKCPRGLWHVRAEVSLTAWLYGSNVKLSEENDIKIGLKRLSDFVSKRASLDFEATTAQVSRVDFAKDFQIGEGNMKQSISKLSNLKVARYTRLTINDKSVYFETRGRQKNKEARRKEKNRVLRTYSKFAEVINRNGRPEEIKIAIGILRIESSFMTLKSVTYLKKKLKLPSREAKVILKSEIADLVLDEAVNRLQLSTILSTNNRGINKFEILNSFYGTSKAQRLLGYLSLHELYGENYYQLPFIETSRSTYYSDLAACRNAGVLL